MNNRFKLKEIYQEILYMIDAWINKGLIKAGLLNRLNLNTLIFQFISHYWEILT